MKFLKTAFTYDAPPEVEVRFPLTGEYRREYHSCTICGHWFSHHGLDMSALYERAYVDATYGDRMRQNYDRVMALPSSRSDNAGRVERVLAFAARRAFGKLPPRLLDVGSGLGVFPARMKQAGWRCVALDPDSRAVEHARDVVGVDAVAGDFLCIDTEILGRFEAISFNKVLEHVDDPVGMLAASLPLLAPGGFVYVEVPDAAAVVEGSGREEFCIEHHHVFSPASLALAAERAGFSLVELERLREPSSKFTLRGFLTAGSGHESNDAQAQISV
jgi:SAM-dependent methyltransferase